MTFLISCVPSHYPSLQQLKRTLKAVYRNEPCLKLPFHYKVLFISFPYEPTWNLHVSWFHLKTTMGATLSIFPCTLERNKYRQREASLALRYLALFSWMDSVAHHCLWKESLTEHNENKSSRFLMGFLTSIPFY